MQRNNARTNPSLKPTTCSPTLLPPLAPGLPFPQLPEGFSAAPEPLKPLQPAPPPPPAARPTPPPPPEPERSYEPLELPKTASQRPALALGGLAALAGEGALRLLRRRS
jgi:LPXTG-motif cell wall-anchored protein